MASKNERRKKILVDAQVQGAMLRQAALYWFWGSATITLVFFVKRVVPAQLSGRSQEMAAIGHEMGLLLIASLVLFPIVMLSTIHFSNRFVGPMLRFRRALRELAQGQTTAPIVLRKRDFWTDVASDINHIAARLESTIKNA
jgi:hypothetical protein